MTATRRREVHAAPPADAPVGRDEPVGYLPRVFRATEELNRREVLAALPHIPGGDLLDIGTHDGEFTARIADRCRARRVCGVELIDKHAAVARARGFAVEHADIDSGLPFADASFDLVTANQVLEHVRRTDRFFAEICRVLRPGGQACISTNNLASWHNVASLALGLQPPPIHVSDERIVGNPLNPEQGLPHEDLGRTHLRLFTGRALRELAALHGLRELRARTSGYYPLPPRVARLATRIDSLQGAFLVSVLGRP